MPVPDFLDTNIFVYGYDITDPRKQRLAQDLIRRALGGQMLASAQVLGEFASVLLHKVNPPTPPQDVTAILDVLAPIKLVSTDADTVRRAVEVRARYGVHFYDGMIIAAAERGGCER